MLLACATSSLLACASIPDKQRTASDPWESSNRTLFDINVAADKVTLKPLATAYRKIIPKPVRKGVSNFFHNLGKPASALNNLLQGKAGNGLSELGGFVVNSTVGIGGLLNVAGASGIEEYPEDFGQTAAVWGMPDGPYVMLPLLGPKTLRDAIFTPLDILADPLFHYRNSSVRDPLYGLRLIDLRYRLFRAEKLLENSKDRYVTVRESYLQNREYEVFDGEPPEDDDFFDDFLDDEEE
jgi:phospholipid-binding lipoprotein MlaA